MNAFSFTPSSLLSKNDACLSNPSLSYQWWFLFLLEQFSARWFAWMRRTGSLLRSEAFRQSPEIQSGRIMNIAAAAWPTCSLHLNRWPARK